MVTKARLGASAPYLKTPSCQPARRGGSLELLGARHVPAGDDLELLDSEEIGADVTFTAVPPSVKIGGIPGWLAVTLGVLGVGAGILLKRR